MKVLGLFNCPCLHLLGKLRKGDKIKIIKIVDDFGAKRYEVKKCILCGLWINAYDYISGKYQRLDFSNSNEAKSFIKEFLID